MTILLDPRHLKPSERKRAIPVSGVTAEGLNRFRKRLTGPQSRWLKACGFNYGGKVWDTMLWEYLLLKGGKASVSLAECCKRSISNRWVFGLTTLVAIAWEIMEYLLLAYRGWAMDWGAVNSLRDLVLGMTGAALIIFLNTKNKRSQYDSDK